MMLRRVLVAFTAVLPGLGMAVDPASAPAHGPAEAPLHLAPWPADAAEPPAPWRFVGLPRQKAPRTAFETVTLDGRRALRIDAESSYGNLMHPLGADGGVHLHRLAWQWRVEQLNEAADLHQRAGDDTTVKLCVLFDLPMAKVPFVSRQLLRVAQASSDGPVPAATVCYVWDSHLPVGTELPSPFTDRLRYVVLESGPERVGQWVGEKRDVGADFLRLFGTESAEVPPVIGIAVGADADNTHRHSVAYVGELTLGP